MTPPHVKFASGSHIPINGASIDGAWQFIGHHGVYQWTATVFSGTAAIDLWSACKWDDRRLSVCVDWGESEPYSAANVAVAVLEGNGCSIVVFGESALLTD